MTDSPYTPDGPPAHAAWWGSLLGWSARAIVTATQLLVVSLAMKVADQPGCLSSAVPNRWPTLGPVLAVTLLATVGAWWFIGRARRFDSTAVWLITLFGIVGAMIVLQVIAVLFLSLSTFC